MDSGTLTPLLKKLEAKVLIERNRSTQDKREMFVHATTNGLALREACAGIPKQVSENIHFTQSDLVALHEMLGRLEGDILG